MSKEETKCPDCKGSRIISGRLLGQTDYGLGHVFRPDGLKIFKFSSTSSDVPVSTKFQTCLDCGLMWNRANKDKVKKTIQALGKDSTKQKLGITD